MEIPATTRVSEAYTRALQAHATAQARYNALKAEIQALRAPGHATRTTDHYQPNYSAETHITLLRQREQWRKLHVIEQALTEINRVQPEDLANDPFNEAVDQVPNDASAPQPLARGNHDAHLRKGSRLAALKNAVLARKRETDEQLAATRSNPTIAKTARSPAAEVIGLRRALNELTEWMERQLSIAADADSRRERSPKDTPVEERSTTQRPSTAEIQALYKQYLAARQRLIGILNQRVGLGVQDPGEVITANNCNVRSRAEPDTNASHTLLPFLATLAATKQEEQALLLRSAYTRQQVSSAESESTRLLARMADESHLVQPGATRGSDWAEAASEAAQSTAEYVGQRLRVGEDAVARGQQALSDLESLPQVLAALAAGGVAT